MNSSTIIGKGEEEKVTVDDVLRRCDAILELLWPIQSRKAVGNVLVMSDDGARCAGSSVNAIGAIGGDSALACGVLGAVTHSGADTRDSGGVIRVMIGDGGVLADGGDDALNANDGGNRGLRAIDDDGDVLGGTICDVLVVGGGSVVLDASCPVSAREHRTSAEVMGLSCAYSIAAAAYSLQEVSAHGTTQELEA
jgi:hypothetical protein